MRLADYGISYPDLGIGGYNVSQNTIRQMIRIIRESSTNPIVRQRATEIVEHVPWKNGEAEVEAIYQWMQQNLRYVHDPVGQEMIVTPPAAIDMIQRTGKFSGDCDDFTVLSLSLLRSIGYPVAIRIASYAPNKVPGHVYGLVKVSGQWIPFDGIKEAGHFGWECPGATYVRDFPIDGR